MAKIVKTPTLETQRLILKPIAVEHAASLEKYFNNWNIVKNLNDKVPWPYPENGVKDHIISDALPRMANGDACIWALFLKDTPKHPIGRIDYRRDNHNLEESNRGFWLAEPYWGHGYMSEAVWMVNDFAFNVLDVPVMRLDNYADNIGSHRIKEKTGARLLRIEKQKWRGEDREMEIWELTAENWKAFKASR